MPWTPADATRHKKGLSPKQCRQWAHVANGMLAACLEDGGSQAMCEARAIRGANSAVGTPALRAKSLQTLTVHLAEAPIRYEQLDGREYLVAPVVPIIASVLNGFLVPADEIAAFVGAWNGIPLPLGHPQNDYGDYLSANAPALLEHSLGRFFNARMDGPRLLGEVWLDVAKCQRLGGEALDCLQRVAAGEQVEVSTAFWSQIEPQEGLWNGVQYSGIHRHLRPDHLAILPDAVGACSCADGCGIRAHACTCTDAGPCQCQEGVRMHTSEPLPGKLRQALRTLFAFAQSPEPADPDPAEEPAPQEESDGEKTETKGDETEETQEQAAGLAPHLTHENIRMALYAALGQHHQRDFAPYYGLDITEIDDGHVMYRMGAQRYRQAYTVDDTQSVRLTGEAEEVQRVTPSVSLAASPSPTVEQQQQRSPTMQTKPELVQALIAHEHTAWTADQTAVLTALEERVLEQMLLEAERRGEEAPLTLQTLKKFLKEELDQRDKSFDAKLATFAQQSEERAEREHIVGYLVTHQGWKEDEASTLPLAALRNIHRMADPVSYVGQGLPRFGQGSMHDDLPSDEPKWD